MQCGDSWVMILRAALFLAAFSLGPRLLAEAVDPAGLAFFEQRVRPVLIEHCHECHSADSKKLRGNLYLDSREGWQRGGDSGEPAIVPGKPEESLFIQSIRHADELLTMPPKKPKLPEAVIADLVTWVKMGAPDPRTGAKIEAKRADKTWWSLQTLKETFSHQDMDSFLVARLRENQLGYNPPADSRTLIRRLSYDLHGLPPSAGEVEAFAKAHAMDGPRAVEALVDRLLASSRYGEHWGRHWLDVVRFGESNGFERNFIIDDLWPFRDYVIRSLNEDKPFNQFIIEHLAGDVIGKDRPEVEVGSAFLVAGPYDDVGNQDPVAQKNIRAATLDDMITATGGAFLGLTINCARCHDHKFDPIPTEDYYRLRAAFEGVVHGRRVVATKDQREANAGALAPLQKQLAELTAAREVVDKAIQSRAEGELARQKPTRAKISVHGTEETFAPVTARHVKFVIRALTSDFQGGPDKRAPGSGRLTEFEVWSAEPEPRNVALASLGATAAGAKSATAEDFPEAYGAQLCIDGQLGEQWFIGTPAELTITLAKPESIGRIRFINAKGGPEVDESRVRGATPCEYEVQVSEDGQSWRTVASDAGREAWSAGHAIARVRREVATPEETARLAGLDREIAATQAKINAVPALPQIWAGNFVKPGEKTFVHKGGDPTKPGAPVAPASLSVLDRVSPAFSLPEDAPEGERRLALARWIASDGNPLTARVLANRVWHYHFGTGLVDTPSDFGFLGSLPSHPELLDFLARRLLAHGWRLKALHREIVLSQAYQQSASWREDGGRLDKSARLLWRFPPRRLSAEEIRDTMLDLAGQLRLEPMGGRGFRLYKFTQNNVSTYFPLDQHGPETYRRAVYHQNARASVVDVLNDFDLPDIAFAAPKRANTTTPLQALTMLNHGFTQDMASALAERVGTEDPIMNAYALAFQRSPTEVEREAAQRLIGTHGLRAFCRALLNSNELLYVE